MAKIAIRFPLIGVFTLLSTPALAEVADKEPTTLALWLVPAFITAIAFIMATKRPWLALLLLPVSLLCAWGQIDELHDPFVGPAIRHELGNTYFFHAYLASATAVAGPFIAWAVFLLRKQRSSRR